MADTDSRRRDEVRARDDVEAIAAPRFSAREIIAEAAAGVTARPGRATLTAFGTVLGIAALVATIGLASTAGAQILTRIDTLAATDVVVSPRQGSASVLRWDAADEVARLNGVSAAGLVSPVTHDGDAPRISAVGVTRAESVDVTAVSPSAFAAVRARLGAGRLLDASDERLDLPTAVLGEAAAIRLRVHDVASAPVVFVDGHPFTVVGTITEIERRPELLGSVIITNAAARRTFGLAAPASLQIETTLGANELIRDQAPTLLSPNHPELLVASTAPLPREVRANVSSDVQALLLTLGAVSLVVGALGIANVTLVSVLERTGEIGLRRALGALRRHIGAQFITESTVLGLVGGTLGTALGILIVIGVSLAKGWHPMLSAIVLVAPLVGALVGLLSGLYPAWRASSIEPAEALRSGA